jgi:peptidoglycan DL-endopeptidase LytF
MKLQSLTAVVLVAGFSLSALALPAPNPDAATSSIAATNSILVTNSIVATGSIAAASSIAAISSNEVISSNSTNSTTAGTYTVVSGDTLDSIAAKEGTTTQLLEDANPGVIPTDLLVGEVLILPASIASSNGTR